MATSGPGATNLVTPIADAYMDSVPIVAITGQVPSATIGTDAFQEADIRGITMPITKHNFLVTDADDIPARDRRGVPHRRHRPSRPGARRHRQGRAAGADHVRRGRETIDLPGYRPVTRPHAKQVREAARLIVEAKRPVLYVGGGVIKARAHAELLRLAELTGIPVVDHADGARRVPGQPPAAPGHARHARHRGRGRRAAEERPADHARRPLRRPRHRPARLVRAGREGDPRRHRPGRDRQEPHRRRADRGRRQARSSPT